MGTGLYLPGNTTNYVSCPDPAALSDFSGILHLAAADWTPATSGGYNLVLGKAATNGANREFLFGIANAGNLWLSLSTSGSFEAGNTTTSDDPTGFTNGEAGWIGFSRSGTTVRFWTSSDGSSWSQLGLDETITASGPLFDGSEALYVQHPLTASNYQAPFTAYKAQLFSGIGANTAPGQGTLVAEFDASLPVEPRYRDSTGKIWTINGSAYAWEGVA